MSKLLERWQLERPMRLRAGLGLDCLHQQINLCRKIHLHVGLAAIGISAGALSRVRLYPGTIIDPHLGISEHSGKRILRMPNIG